MRPPFVCVVLTLALVAAGCQDQSTFFDYDGDGYADHVDCDPNDAEIHPGADEVCDELDNDCDGDVDEDDPMGLTTFYEDADGDGFGDTSSTVDACFAPTGYGEDATDCDDTDAAVYPGAPDVCDEIDDNDCDGATDPSEEDGDGDGASSCEGDCDDSDAAVGPHATEICNGVDDDCDGSLTADEVDADGDSEMACVDCDDADADLNGLDADTDGVSSCDGDCDDADAGTTADNGC